MRIGSLNCQITFERKVAGDAFDGSGDAWQVAAEGVWAEVQDVLPSRAERMADGMSIANRPARIRLRYRTDITADMRIRYGERILQIVAGPAELGRREGLELMAESYSTAGGA